MLGDLGYMGICQRWCCGIRCASCGLCDAMFPWVSSPLSLLGVFAGDKATIDLVDAFWDGLIEEQQCEA